MLGSVEVPSRRQVEADRTLIYCCTSLACLYVLMLRTDGSTSASRA